MILLNIIMGECRVITDSILIESIDLENAKNICCSISDADVRNKSVANVLAANLAKKILENESIDIDTESGLHNIAEILNDIDLSDIYINGKYVDVRLCIDDGAPSIPLNMVNNGILPAVYMFLRTTSELKSAELLGFFEPKNLSGYETNGAYYFVDVNELVQFENIKDLFNPEHEENNVVDDEEIYSFLECSSDSQKYEFYKKILKSKDGRKNFIKIMKAQSILNLVSRVSDVELHADDNLNNNDIDVSVSQENIFSDLLNEDSIEPEENIIDTTLSLLEEPIKENYPSEYNTIIEENIIDDDNVADKNPEFDEYADNISFEQNNFQNDADTNNLTENDEENSSIDDLFNENNFDNADSSMPKSSNALPKVIIISFIILLITIVSFLIFSKFFDNKDKNQVIQEISNASTDNSSDVQQFNSENAPMPSESVENNLNVNLSKETANPVVISSIEKNLDSTVLVSNLKVDWEVPAGYASNTTAKRYMIKLGKIIQLNLKSELLLLSKLPITNNIMVEIKFNNSLGQFETVGILSSSGEKSVDKIITDTVNKALRMKLSSNPSAFNKLKGNPVLVIHF